MGENAKAEAAARRFIEEYNRCTADWVYAVHAEDFTWIELPVHGVYPGHVGGREDLRKLSLRTVERFPGRRMELLDVLASGNRAAMQIEWAGTAIADSDEVKAGESVRLNQATFIDIDDTGMVTRQLDYTVRVA
jgi:hypothetical protein